MAALVVIDPWGLSPFGPLKWALVSVLVPAAMVLLPGRGRALVVARRPARSWAVFLLAVAVASAFGVDPLYAWIGTPERHFGALTWLLCGLAFVAGQQLDEDDSRFVCLMAVVVALVVGLWAAVEQIGWEPVRLVGAGDRPVATLGSSAYLGAVAALLVPVSLGIAIDPRWQRSARRFAGSASAAGVGALVVSGARAGWVGLGVVGVFGVVLRRQRIAARRRDWRAVRRRLTVTAALAVAAVAGLGALTGAGGRIADAANERDGGARGRLDEWRVGARVVGDHLLVGSGPEGYRISFGHAVDQAYERDHGRDPLPDRAHSAVLDVAATTGVVGLAAFACVILLSARFVVRAVRAGPLWVAGVATGVAAYGVQALFLFPVAEIDPVAWLLAGVVVARVARKDELVRLRPPRAVPVIAGAVAAAALVAGTLDVVADRVAKRTLAAAADGRAVDATAAARLRPDAVRYRLVAARALESGTAPGAHRKALEQLDRALDVSPRDPVAGAERARLLLDRARRTAAPADIATAAATLRALARRDPRNGETQLRLGIALDLSGNAAGAERAWLAAEHLAPASAAAPANLALAYAEAGRWDEARAAAMRALRRDPGNEQARRVLDDPRGFRPPDGT
ncbi:MAG TPA: O-antigen ligase family protein [Acidimicrobiales bacterium]|nr:O-antigen ligase family protein [Acidimicrobiales bacterium]